MKIQKWEYRTLEAELHEEYGIGAVDMGELNRFGLEGWEAVGASFEYHRGDGHFCGVLLKRPTLGPVDFKDCLKCP